MDPLKPKNVPETIVKTTFKKRKGKKRKNVRRRDKDADNGRGESNINLNVKPKKQIRLNSFGSTSVTSMSKEQRKKLYDETADVGGASTDDKTSELVSSYKSTRSAKPQYFAGHALDQGNFANVAQKNFEKAQAAKQEAKTINLDSTVGVVKEFIGTAGYTKHIQNAPGEETRNKNTGSHGPIKNKGFVRSTIRMDHEPEVCKDFKTFGWCGWGDTCIFLHDRSDYKRGWQVERDWDVEQNEKRKRLLGKSIDKSGKGDVGEDDGGGLPFACLICCERFTNPVITNCGHYFCEACAIKRHLTDKTCKACGKDTGGFFNKCSKMDAKMRETYDKTNVEIKKKTSTSKPNRGGWTVETKPKPNTPPVDDSIVHAV